MGFFGYDPKFCFVRDKKNNTTYAEELLLTFHLNHQGSTHRVTLQLDVKGQCFYFFSQIVLRHSEHPPIMKDPSWTRAAPFKETAHARTPSESIANNYTPSANSLKIRNLAKLQTPVRPPSRIPTQQACILSLINTGNIIVILFGNNMNRQDFYLLSTS